jgi:hypothetical protein
MPYLRRLVTEFPSGCPGFDPKSDHVGFVVDKAALRRVLFEYLGCLCQFCLQRLLDMHLSLMLYSPDTGSVVK